MADFNISANFNINPPNRKFPTACTSISFQAAQACVITFTPSTGNCFGVASVSLAGGPADVDLPVVSAVTTDGSAAAPPPPSPLPKPDFQQNPDTFEITFGN